MLKEKWAMTSYLSIGTVLVCTCLAFSGCTSGRVTVTVSSDPDAGENIRTRNLYRISDYRDAEEEKFVSSGGKLRHRMVKVNTTMLSCRKYQPGVFAPDGIPVVVKDGDEDYSLTKNGSVLGDVLCVCSIGILPGWTTRGMTKTFVIETVNGQRVDQRVTVDMNYFTVFCNCFIPVSRWIWCACQSDGPQVIGGHRAFVTSFYHGNSFWTGFWDNGNGPTDRAYTDYYLQRAMVYALAVRLKRLEDEHGAQLHVSGGDK